MNEPVRGPNRPMASGRRPSRPGPARSRDGDSAADLERVQPRIPWSRRIGIVVALLALGGTVVLAGGFGSGGKPGALDSQHPAASSAATPRGTVDAKGPTPKTAPVIATPSSLVTGKKAWTAHVTVTATGIARRNLSLRIYRNNAAVLNVPVKNGTSMGVKNIPLKNGTNAISAAFVSPGGEGPRSNVVTMTLDDIAPRINLAQPKDHAIVNAPSVTLTGLTEPGSTVEVQNLTQAHKASTTADTDGRFSLAVALAEGGNDLALTATDAVGNVGHAQITVTRGSGVATAQLTLSRTTFRRRQLPITFDVSLLVIDANGLAVDGAAVTFSLSPPGLPTSTYQATTQGGRASWSGVTLSDGLQAGDGFVTARVTLPDGSVLQATAPFTVR